MLFRSYCTGCGKEIINEQTIGHLQTLFRKHGSDVWFAREAGDLVPEGLICPGCGKGEFSKETDIMDVWFDSGSSHLGVLDEPDYWPELSWPADLYLEGSDQHRGWFNSSLSTSVAVTGQAPYRAVLTHGFVVDEQGRKMSKSLGNVVDPLKVIQQMGADILRLWVSSAEYRGDLAVSQNILKQMSEAYRKIRNTCRFLLGNLNDFNPALHRVSREQMPEIDRYAMLRLQRLIDKVSRAYREYDFHVVYHSVHNFCAVEMSALYLDVVKDRLYCDPAASTGRRSAQTVLYAVLDDLVRLLVPVLAFTTEEIWRHMPDVEGKPASVQLADLPEVDESYLDPDLESRWKRLLEVRGLVTGTLEVARKNKVIGNSLEAAVHLYADGDTLTLLEGYQDHLPALFIVSGVKLAGPGEPWPGDAATDEDLPGLAVKVDRAPGAKCERCWVYHPGVGLHPEHTTVCPRCEIGRAHV